MADSTEHRVWLDKHFHVACVAQLGVSFLILYKDKITLFSTTLCGTGSKLGDSLLWWLLMSRMWSSSLMSLYLLAACCLYTLSHEVSPASLLREEAVMPVTLCNTFTWNGYSWKFITEASAHQELAWGQPRHCEVRFGTERKGKISV